MSEAECRLSVSRDSETSERASIALYTVLFIAALPS